MNQTIYIALLDEGAEVWRPAEAEALPGGLFRILGPVPEEENWEFPPGSLVRCREKRFSDGARGQVAYKLAS